MPEIWHKIFRKMTQYYKIEFRIKDTKVKKVFYIVTILSTIEMVYRAILPEKLLFNSWEKLNIDIEKITSMPKNEKIQSIDCIIEWLYENGINESSIFRRTQAKLPDSCNNITIYNAYSSVWRIYISESVDTSFISFDEIKFGTFLEENNIRYISITKKSDTEIEVLFPKELKTKLSINENSEVIISQNREFSKIFSFYKDEIEI